MEGKDEERDVEKDEDSVVSMMVEEIEGDREKVEEVVGIEVGEKEEVEELVGIEVEGMEIGGEGETVEVFRRCEHSNWQCHKSSPVAR